MNRYVAITMALMLTAGGLLAGAPSYAQSKGEIVIGVQCDRTGATQIVGTVLCPGFHDYIALVNSKGGVEGRMLKVLEIDHEYKGPQGVEAYERHKKDGAVTMAIYGTPHIYALAAKLTEDRIPGTSPGFGSAAAADGIKYPYIFPIAATYWSQGTAGVDFAKKQLGGNLKGKKIAYLFYDNPAGREPIEVIEDLATKEGFQLKTFAVPPPAVEMGAQVLDIAQRFRADFVIAHLFGAGPGVSIKELKRVGYPLRKVVSFVWGAAEANIEAAGGFSVAEGYYAMQFAGVGTDYPVLNEIREVYKKQGKPAPIEVDSTVYYNRGVLIAAPLADYHADAQQHRGHLRQRDPRPQGRVHQRPRGRDHDAARRQRRRQDDDAQGDLRPAALGARRHHQGRDRAGRRAHRPSAAV